MGLADRGYTGMVLSDRAYGGRRLFLYMACVGNSRCMKLVFLNAGKGEGLSVAGGLRLYFLARVVLFLVLGSGTLGSV